MDRVSRITYDSELNLVLSRRGDESKVFLAKKGYTAIRSFFDFTLSRVESQEGDVHLVTCLWEVYSLTRHFPISEGHGGLTLLAFPKFGEIERYVLCQENFLTNAHSQHVDPVVITNLPVRIPLDTSSDAVYVTGSRRCSSFPNLITSALLLKKPLNKDNYSWLSRIRGISD